MEKGGVKENWRVANLFEAVFFFKWSSFFRLPSSFSSSSFFGSFPKLFNASENRTNFCHKSNVAAKCSLLRSYLFIRST